MLGTHLFLLFLFFPQSQSENYVHARTTEPTDTAISGLVNMTWSDFKMDLLEVPATW